MLRWLVVLGALVLLLGAAVTGTACEDAPPGVSAPVDPRDVEP